MEQEKSALAGCRCVSFSGRSWFVENVRQFNARASFEHAATGTIPSVYCLDAEGFGASMWHEGCDPQAPPTFWNYLGKIPTQYFDYIRNSHCRLVIDISNEAKSYAATKQYINVISRALEVLGIRNSSVFLLTQNTKYNYDYISSLSSSDEQPIQIINYDFFPIRFARDFVAHERDEPAPNELESPISRRKNFYFNCLNFSAREHRIGIVSWLFGRGYESRGLISFRRIERFGNGGYMSDIKVPGWFPDQKAALAGAKKLGSCGHLILDLDEALVNDSSLPTPDCIIPDRSIYRNSYFSIVTESDVSNGDVLRITEKTMKPIAGLSPFVIVGNPFSLDVLKGLGFKTFSPLIGEMYDRILDPVQRISAILYEIDRLMRFDEGEILDWSQKISDIVDYNYHHLLNQYGRNIDEIEVAIVDKLTK